MWGGGGEARRRELGQLTGESMPLPVHKGIEVVQADILEKSVHEEALHD